LKTHVKKIKTLLCSSLFISSIGLSLVAGNVHAAQSPEWISMHGSVCQGANLGQSINLGTDWTPRGVRNDQAIGSNKFFFVVCPITITDDKSSTEGSDIYVMIDYRERDEFNRVSCTASRFGQGGDLVKNVMKRDTSTIRTGAIDTSAKVTMVLQNVVNDSDSGYAAILEFGVVVVCALPPGAGINALSFNHNDEKTSE
jgi:hypothetical protein